MGVSFLSLKVMGVSTPSDDLDALLAELSQLEAELLEAGAPSWR